MEGFVIWYNDDDSESEQANWKNSEVMSLFVQALNNKENSTVEVKEEMGGDNNVSGKMNEDDNTVQAHKTLDSTIEKLAQLSSQYGNEKVKYLIERATDELIALKESDNEI